MTYQSYCVEFTNALFSYKIDIFLNKYKGAE